MRIQEEENLFRLLRRDFNNSTELDTKFQVSEIMLIPKIAKKVEVSDFILTMLSKIRKAFITYDINMSDRKFDDTMTAFKVSSLLNLRKEVCISELFLLLHISWTTYIEKDRVRDILWDEIFGNKNDFESAIQNGINEYDSINSIVNSELVSVINYEKKYTDKNIEKEFLVDLNNISVIRDRLERLYDFVLNNIVNPYNFILDTEAKIEANKFVLNHKANVFTNEMIDNMYALENSAKNALQTFNEFVENNESVYDYLRKQEEIRLANQNLT
jgi:hypothetical protein